VSNQPIRISRFTVTHALYAFVLEPFRAHDRKLRYSIRVPAEDYPECPSRDQTVNVSSSHPPLIVIGDDSGLERSRWEHLCAEATRYRYPPNKLLLGRPVEVAGETWASNTPYLGHTIHTSLRAVKIGGDFEKDEGLEEHIRTVLGWFA